MRVQEVCEKIITDDSLGCVCVWRIYLQLHLFLIVVFKQYKDIQQLWIIITLYDSRWYSFQRQSPVITVTGSKFSRSPSF